jgi:Icc-related predicted phosphoesterase
MKIQIMSDLHLEFGDMKIENHGADVLILSGDIIVKSHFDKTPVFRDFLDRCSKSFKNVVYVAGNHEFYGSMISETQQFLRSLCGEYSNIHFLDNAMLEIDGIVFVGSTLWTDCNREDPLTMNMIMSRMNDYQIIRNDLSAVDRTTGRYKLLHPFDTVEFHKKTLAYFQEVLEANMTKKCVVVGHHAPSTASIHPKYSSDFHLNGAYSSNLSDFVLDRPQIKLWTHGHTHSSFDYMIGPTRVVCNPRGYAGYEVNPQFDMGKIVEV